MSDKISNSDKQHLDYLDGLRALAALYVVIHHSVREMNVGENTFTKIMFMPTIFGHNAVILFIVLSGFCLMLPVTKNGNYLKSTLKTYFYKRAKRIIPTYYLAIIFCLILIYNVIDNNTTTLWKGVASVNTWDLITHFMLIHEIFTETSRTINYVFWSVAVEWKIYFLFPLLIVGWRKVGPFTTTFIALIGSILIGVALAQLDMNINLKSRGLSPHFLSLFTMGMLSCHISFYHSPLNDKIKKSKIWNFVWAILLLIIIAIGLAPLKFHKLCFLVGIKGEIVSDIISGLFCFSLLIGLSNGNLKNFKKFLAIKPLVFIGGFSYSLYLIHAPLIEIIMRYIMIPNKLTGVLGILLISTFGTLLITFISYAFFLVAEKPFLTKKRKSQIDN